MEKSCQVCDLPCPTRNEIEGMLLGGWTPEDLEHWIALRFRLNVSTPAILHHYEQCYLNPPLGRELIEVAGLKAGLVFYCLFPRQHGKQDLTPAFLPDSTLGPNNLEEKKRKGTTSVSQEPRSQDCTNPETLL